MNLQRRAALVRKEIYSSWCAWLRSTRARNEVKYSMKDFFSSTEGSPSGWTMRYWSALISTACRRQSHVADRPTGSSLLSIYDSDLHRISQDARCTKPLRLLLSLIAPRIDNHSTSRLVLVFQLNTSESGRQNKIDHDPGKLSLDLQRALSVFQSCWNRIYLKYFKSSLIKLTRALLSLCRILWKGHRNSFTVRKLGSGVKKPARSHSLTPIQESQSLPKLLFLTFKCYSYLAEIYEKVFLESSQTFQIKIKVWKNTTELKSKLWSSYYCRNLKHFFRVKKEYK